MSTNDVRRGDQGRDRSKGHNTTPPPDLRSGKSEGEAAARSAGKGAILCDGQRH